MIQEFIKAMFLIFMAEMGDKTQILAMAFATRYKVSKVLLGIFIGSLLNHGVAVALGSYMSKVIPINIIQIVAGISFIGFALWTLRAEEEEEEEEAKSSFGPVLTVAIAFFIGELGDKTQLTAITLSADAQYPLFILMGTVTGMVITGSLGILVGSKLGNRIPEFTIKIASAAIFMFFGITKLFATLPKEYLTPVNTIIFFIVLALCVFLILKPTIEERKKGKLSTLRQVSEELYQYYNQINERIENICLGENYCIRCQGKNCLIGYTKEALKSIIEDSVSLPEEGIMAFENSLKKNYSQEELIGSLAVTVNFILNNMNHSKELQNVHTIRQILERLLLKEIVGEFHTLKQYIAKVENINHLISVKLLRRIETIKKEDTAYKIS
ncbi:TMEM165/GDT1 family protein [Clostridium thermarum]|uniref:TMEM165/GDT1 family protein n=1 Tax=Clostridium thermarum TaxID=1716543 RepID=UPI0013D043F9|nr:TMEM165/GDT1 family protein [Clostridium thermarum]